MICSFKQTSIFNFLLFLFLFIRASSAHASVTSYSLGSYMEHAVLVRTSSAALDQQVSLLPIASLTASYSTSASDPNPYGGVATSATDIVASETGATISASIGGGASMGFINSIGFQVSAVQGSGPSWLYTFTVDTPSRVQLHGHSHGGSHDLDGYSIIYFLNSGIGSPNNSNHIIPGMSFSMDSSIQGDVLDNVFDSGSVLLQPGSYTLCEELIASATPSLGVSPLFSILLDLTLTIDSPRSSRHHQQKRHYV